MNRSMILMWGLIGLGAVSGALSGRLPLHGKAAIGLALLPCCGVALAMKFC